MNKKVIVVVRDGWGARQEKEGNYIKQADTPNTDFYEKNFPYVELGASGSEVGIPAGKMGNSEIGHLHIGAGRVIPQSLMQINNAIEDGSFLKNVVWKQSLEHAEKNNSTIHVMILMQEAGVHSHITHLLAYIGFLKRHDFENYNIHLITDGRDEDPKSSRSFIKKIKDDLGSENHFKIKTVCGRFFALDRNGNMDRTQRYFNALVLGKTANVFQSSEIFIGENYENEVTDEFLYPAKKEGYEGFSQNDSVVFLNFRTDRARQISDMICHSDWVQKRNVKLFTMTKYHKELCAPAAFSFPKIENTLSQQLVKNFKRQLRLAESEKAAHVTFFFDGQEKVDDMLIEKIILDSPNVKTYDLKPEMRALDLADIAVEKIREDKTEFIFMNFANADMVGHTGDKDAILKSISSVDTAIGKIVSEASAQNWVVILAADHGNAEDKTEKYKTSHTLNPIPFSLISEDEKFLNITLKENMGLKNIAATVLEVMGIDKSEEMEESLIVWE